MFCISRLEIHGEADLISQRMSRLGMYAGAQQLIRSCEESWLHHSPLFPSPEIHKPNEITYPEGLYLGSESLLHWATETTWISSISVCILYALWVLTISWKQSMQQGLMRPLTLKRHNSSYLLFYKTASLIYTQLNMNILILYKCSPSCLLGSVAVQYFILCPYCNPSWGLVLYSVRAVSWTLSFINPIDLTKGHNTRTSPEQMVEGRKRHGRGLP